jgi:gliding motility-associated-like protein
MLLINGAQQANVVVWSQQVTVTPNTNYAFSAWLQHMTTLNPAILQFSINGIPIGNTFQANSVSCIWDRFYAVWNSGSNTTATISILNQNTGFSGNDFALDDIEFAELKILRDSVKVNVLPKPVVDLGPDKTFCSVSNLVLDAGNAGAGFLWQDGSTQQTFTANSFGKYYVRVSSATGCMNSDTIIFSKASPIPADFQFKQDICDPLKVQFTGMGTGLLNPYWSFGDGNTSTGNFTVSHTYPAYANYTVKFGIEASACKDTITKVISIQLTNSNLILTPDTTICFNSTKQLRTQPGALDFCWSPVTYLDNPNAANPVTSTPQKMTYYYTAQMTGANLITNGDFNNGNTDINSKYQYSSSGLLPGVYFVGKDPAAWHPGMSACKDHTTGTGNMLLINGAQQANVVVWSQQVTVTPNTNYAFSAWLQHVTTINPAILQFSINGIPIGNVFQANSTSCIWDRFYTAWNSGNNTTAIISILNQNTGFSGNDFALDDISFAPVFIQRDSVIISVDTPIVQANRDTTICLNGQVQLQATGGATWSWTPATGLNNTTISTPVATPAVNTDYIVTAQTSHGCIAKDTVAVRLFPIPTIITNHDTTVCANTPVQLAANNNLMTYAWTPAATLDNATIANPVAMPGRNTIYKVQVTDAYKCSYTDSVNVTMRRIRFGAILGKTICQGTSTILRAMGGDRYQWSPAGSLSDASIAAPVATPDTTTYYRVNISESHCGTDTTITVWVKVNPMPVVKAEKINDIDCLVHSAKLKASGSAGSSYLWAPNRGLDFPTLPEPICSADSTITYFVTSTNQYGCSALDSVTVYVTATNKASFEVPNAFTPNGDGVNDCFGLKSWGGATIEEFSIFSRWGERVFTTNKQGTCWDGRFRGESLPSGGYPYIIKAKTPCGYIKRTGIVMLIR